MKISMSEIKTKAKNFLDKAEEKLQSGFESTMNFIADHPMLMFTSTIGSVIGLSILGAKVDAKRRLEHPELYEFEDEDESNGDDLMSLVSTLADDINLQKGEKILIEGTENGLNLTHYKEETKMFIDVEEE